MRDGIGARLISGDPHFVGEQDRLVLLAAHYSLSTVCQWREFATIGDLISYGTSILDAYQDKRRNEMRRTPIALIVLVSLVSVSNLVTSAMAASYPVCLAGGSNNALRCNYASFQECRASASGGLGYCVANPTSVFDAHASSRRSGKLIIDLR